jgi:hypothetical protein
MRRPPAQDEDFARRSRRGLWLGAAVGVVVGAAAGYVIGVVAFDGAGPILGSTLAGVIFAGGLGAFLGGLSTLEPPTPGRELSGHDPGTRPQGAGRDADDGVPLVVEEHFREPHPDAGESPRDPGPSGSA